MVRWRVGAAIRVDPEPTLTRSLIRFGGRRAIIVDMASTITRRASFARQREGRLLGGVAVALARRWRLDPGVVRFGFLILSLAGGVGVVLYLLLWVLTPISDDVSSPPVATSWRDSVAALAVIAGAMLVLRSAGLWFSDGIALLGALGAIGVSLVWGRADRPDLREVNRLGAGRIAAGLVLLIVGFTTAVVATADLQALGQTLVAAGVAAVGLALLLTPRLVRTADELQSERRARIRSEERAEIAAHLHDGVLQTLALIQRQPGVTREVAALARRQERELRGWLCGEPVATTETLAGTLRSELAAVEDGYGVRVELIVVGDAPADERTRALVGAVREATTNAARHAGVDQVDVYVEVGDERVEAFVRDRGRGFDPTAVPADRMGLAESVVGRVRRAGGSVAVRSRAGDGTEVSMTLPRHEP
jgi:signal transduction histidine kinase